MAYFVNKLGKRGWHNGMYFGGMIGVFLAILALGNYLFLPMSMALPVMWAVAIFVTSACVGAIAGACNR